MPLAEEILPVLMVSSPDWLVDNRPVPEVAAISKSLKEIGAELPTISTPIFVLPVMVVVPVALTPVVPLLLCKLMPVFAPLTVRPAKFSVPVLLLTATPVLPFVIVVPLTFSVPVLALTLTPVPAEPEAVMVELLTVNVPALFVRLTPLAPAPEIAIPASVISPAALEPLIFTPSLAGFVTFMLLSDTVPDSLLMRIPSPIELAMVPPEPAVVPVPVTVNVPAALFKSIPLVPPVVLTLCRVTFKGAPVPVPAMFTPSPLALEMAPPLTVSVPVWPFDSKPVPLVAAICRLLNVTAAELLSTRTPFAVLPLTVVVPVAVTGPALLLISTPVAAFATVRVARLFVAVAVLFSICTPMPPPVTVVVPSRANAPLF